MSIRYTLRHNIPSEKIAAEDVNDSSTWDLNLLRKHELAETNDHSVVYRQHDGKIVDWAAATTQRAAEILSEIEQAEEDVNSRFNEIQDKIDSVETDIAELTVEAEEAAEEAS